MWLRPWHVIVCVLGLSFALIAGGYAADNVRVKDVCLGLGVNLLSSVVFFVLLELYWQRMKRANGKEVDGFDYDKFARNVARSKQVRVLGTFIYPLTDNPGHAGERQALLAALRSMLARASCQGVQMLFLHPESQAARSRAAERKDDDVLLRIDETLRTLRELTRDLEGTAARQRISVRLFSRTPPFSLFQTDTFGSISFYFRDRPVSEAARLEFFMDSPIGDFVEKTFDDLWRDQRTVRLEDYAGPAAVARPAVRPA